ncbi:MAG: ATP-binding cassette domain-containing protein [Actinomycetes bacterium]|jgi:ABC-type Mn2+/Zn2+ transport system ATPase subunit
MISISRISINRGETLVLQDFSATILERQATLLSGPNGSGKTSLIQAIAGTLPISTGEISIDGANPFLAKALDLAKLRSVAPQRRTFSLAFSVAEVIDFIPVKERADHWENTLELLGLKQFLNKKVTELSIGQQQRVSLSLSLLQESKFYLLDEPFSAQDSEYQIRILQLIDELRKEKGVLVVSHNTDSLHSHFDQELHIS